MNSQRAEGDQNVQIENVVDSTVNVVFGSPRRSVPLDPAVVPVDGQSRSPARLLRARAAVIPFAVRHGLLRSLQAWCERSEPFAVHLIGGPGGTGKTRLGVELCRQMEQRGWWCGLLRGTDETGLDVLAAAAASRLVVVDYAETRLDQLELLLPRLEGTATDVHPVRVLLLVRDAPRRTGSWTEAIQGHSEVLDAYADRLDLDVLVDVPLSMPDRRKLFRAATTALSAQLPDAVSASHPPELARAHFATPLLVVMAAYLQLRDPGSVPATRGELFEELLVHEDRYWRQRAETDGLDIDATLRRRAVALATLAGASSEADAVELLRLVPDLADSTAERRGRLARWLHRLYPGPAWWNRLDPDPLAEHLVATTYHDHRAVLAGALDDRPAAALSVSLDMYTHAASDHPDFARAVRPIIAERLPGLCNIAVEETAREPRLDFLLGATSLAAALVRASVVYPADPATLPTVLNSLPRRPDLALTPLAVTLTSQLVGSQRRAEESTGEAADLAVSLNNLSLGLLALGRRREGLAAIEEAVSIRRQLAATHPDTYDADLAVSLNNLSVTWGALGRREQGLKASQEAVDMYRELAATDRHTHLPNLATALNNLSNRLALLGHLEEALSTIEEAVTIRYQLAESSPATYLLPLAASLNNLAQRLGKLGRRDEVEGVVAKAIEAYGRLSAANPTADLPKLATSLNDITKPSPHRPDSGGR